MSLAVAAADTLRAGGAIACASCRCRAGACSRSRTATTGTRCCRPAVTARVAVEAGASLGWDRFVGDAGAVVGVDRFGASAPGDVVMREFGFTPEHVADAARALLG